MTLLTATDKWLIFNTMRKEQLYPLKMLLKSKARLIVITFAILVSDQSHDWFLLSSMNINSAFWWKQLFAFPIFIECKLHDIRDATRNIPLYHLLYAFYALGQLLHTFLYAFLHYSNESIFLAMQINLLKLALAYINTTSPFTLIFKTNYNNQYISPK